MTSGAARSLAWWLVVCLGTPLLLACGEVARLPVSAGTGPQPTLPEPRRSVFPTVNIAPAQGWSSQAVPDCPTGTEVRPFAQGLDHPRWLLVLPNGDVLVAETNAPDRPDGAQGIKGWIMRMVMKRAGAGTPSANRITLLRDTQGTGIADQRFVLLEGLNSPLGMAYLDGALFVANTDAVLRFPYTLGSTRITEAGSTVATLPAGTINHHWTKNLLPSPDGRQLYVTVGSNSNVAERGLAAEVGRAAIWQIDIATGAQRIFASGLRNPNGMAFEPATGALWTVVNERDELGSDLVPDYLTTVADGDFFGWPWSWYGDRVDDRVQPAQPERVAQARVPDYALGPHTAPLGLAWSGGTTLPARFAQGMFVGQHGSWNRAPHSGYKVIFIPFEQGRPSGPPVDVLTGFLSVAGRAHGRPVGVTLDTRGALLVADDVGNVVWRVSSRR